MWCIRRHALELGAARAEQTAAWLNTHVFMPLAERAEWAHLVSHLVLWTLRCKRRAVDPMM